MCIVMVCSRLFVCLWFQELLESVRESCSSVVGLPPAFVRDLVIEQVGTDVSNKLSAMNLAVAMQLSDRIIDEATDALKTTVDRLVSACDILHH